MILYYANYVIFYQSSVTHLIDKSYALINVNNLDLMLNLNYSSEREVIITSNIQNPKPAQKMKITFSNYVYRYSHMSPCPSKPDCHSDVSFPSPFLLYTNAFPHCYIFSANLQHYKHRCSQECCLFLLMSMAP